MELYAFRVSLLDKQLWRQLSPKAFFLQGVIFVNEWVVELLAFMDGMIFLRSKNKRVFYRNKTSGHFSMTKHDPRSFSPGVIIRRYTGTKLMPLILVLDRIILASDVFWLPVTLYDFVKLLILLIWIILYKAKIVFCM